MMRSSFIRRFSSAATGRKLERTAVATSTSTTTSAHVVEDDTVQLSGHGLLPVTSKLSVVDTQSLAKWPVFRVLGRDGKLLPDAQDALPKELTKEKILDMYKIMVRVQALDDIFYNAQRQGRISFYMQNAGEEAIHVGSAAALEPDDVILAQYREVGVLLYRGFSLQQAADQCFSNESDLGKGRQMPVHYGSKALNFQTISSPLATQLPQAVGAAYALKLSAAKTGGPGAVSICYFGEGAASEGDFHAALNFAATLEAPVVFFCRNNGYAISTPTKDQFRGDGIISRAAGYGMHGIRVDGNDAFAVYLATRAARQLALEKGAPVLVEAMSYRRGHHSTSDDSTRYRSMAEIKHWQDHLDPVFRLRTYISSEERGWWSADEEQALRDRERVEVLQSLERAEKKRKPALDEMFNDVYADMPAHLAKQRQQLLDHMARHPGAYDDAHSGH